VNLKKLHLFENSLTGSIPSELGLLANLEEFKFGENILQGAYALASKMATLTPSRTLISFLIILIQIFVSLSVSIALSFSLSLILSCIFTGAIPSELGKAFKLEILHVYNNSLTGSIPSELGLLANLEEFKFGENMLQGAYALDSKIATPYID
jgi:Leucine-rich repeat (LRR) protein